MQIVWAASATGSLIIIFNYDPAKFKLTTVTRSRIEFILIVYCIIIYLSFLTAQRRSHSQSRNGKYIMIQYTIWIMDKPNSFPTLLFELFSSILPAQGSHSGNIHSRSIHPIFCGQTFLLSLVLFGKHKYFKSLIILGYS